MPEPTYTNEGATTLTGETPLEAAARREAAQDGAAAQDRREEREADTLMADIDTYVARTDPDSLPQAEQALNAWEIPTDPLEGVPGDVALAPGVEGEPFVSVFTAQSESEANIVRGVIEASGIPVTFDGLPAPILGSVFQAGKSRWGDLLVPASQAEQARAAIAEATSPSDLPSN